MKSTKRAIYKSLGAMSILLFSMVSATESLAHHSFAAEFDGKKMGTVEAVVDEVWFNNPHVRYYVTVNNEAGQGEKWELQTMSPVLIFRSGWTKETVKVGDRVKVTGAFGRDGAKKVFIYTLITPDGTTLGTSRRSED